MPYDIQGWTTGGYATWLEDTPTNTLLGAQLTAAGSASRGPRLVPSRRAEAEFVPEMPLYRLAQPELTGLLAAAERLLEATGWQVALCPTYGTGAAEMTG